MKDANRSESDAAGGGKLAIDMTPKAIEERLKKVWQLTAEKWARKGIDITKLPMQKDVERVIRLKDK